MFDVRVFLVNDEVVSFACSSIVISENDFTFLGVEDDYTEFLDIKDKSQTLVFDRKNVLYYRQSNRPVHRS